MPVLRLALAQVDPTVGDLAANAAQVRGHTRKAAESGAHLVAFPEMMLTGHPVEDLVFRETFVAASQAAIEALARDLAADGPSAELRPGQLDTDSLPRFEQLDALLADYIDGDLGREALLAAGHDPELVARVVRMVDLAEYRRRQSAPGPKISIKAFGRDRRLPITNRFQG
jgi:hypothetical protein